MSRNLGGKTSGLLSVWSFDLLRVVGPFNISVWQNLSDDKAAAPVLFSEKKCAYEWPLLPMTRDPVHELSYDISAPPRGTGLRLASLPPPLPPPSTSWSLLLLLLSPPPPAAGSGLRLSALCSPSSALRPPSSSRRLFRLLL